MTSSGSKSRQEKATKFLVSFINQSTSKNAVTEKCVTCRKVLFLKRSRTQEVYDL